MKRQIEKVFISLVYIMFDIVSACLAIYLACWLRANGLFFEVNFYNLFWGDVNPFRYVFAFWVFSAVLTNIARDLHKTRRELMPGVEMFYIVQSVLISSIMLVVCIYVFKIKEFPRGVFFIGMFLNFIFFTVWRFLKRTIVNFLVAGGYNNFNVVIIGAGKVGKTLYEEIVRRPELGIKVIGFLDDTKTESPVIDGPPILGKVSDLKVIARQEFIDKIFITTFLDSKIFIKVMEVAKALNLNIRVVPFGFEYLSHEVEKYNIGIIPVLEYYNKDFLRKQFGKRIFDIVLGALLLVLFLPLFIIISLMIKLDSPGPIFHFSYRYGRNGWKFFMFKFRSMVKDAEKELIKYKHQNEVDGPIFKLKNDPRITKIGKFLRKYSIDELPQLINVIKGDMSLVGPRPFVVQEVEKQDLLQLKRLEVRPGMTGLWQVQGRSDLSFNRLLKWDVWYINNWSFWLDMNILLKTIPVVLKGRGAY
ncbi:MAG: sugar transferase [Candidatus Omnitrophica bacterium]|nr:sugar transferase [Candidatus Omnitrophota bacterium]